MSGSTIEKPGVGNIVIKTAEQICIMQEANQIVAEILATVEKSVDIGITTWELDRIAEDHCQKMHANTRIQRIPWLSE